MKGKNVGADDGDDLEEEGCTVGTNGQISLIAVKSVL